MPHSIQVKSLLNKTKRRDPWFLDDYTLNPFSGCAFNCLFCYIRGSKYGTHMGDKVAVKANAIEVLEKQLRNRAKKNQHGVIVVSSATEPYSQLERELQLTRRILELILKYRFPVHILTRSDLVVRDFDLLREIDAQAILPKELEGKVSRNVFVTFSFSTLSNEVAKIFEPGATPPDKRLQTLKATLDAGFFSGVAMMPLLPYISDTGENLELMFSTFKQIGAKYVMPATLTLFGNESSDSKTLMFRAIAEHYPHLFIKYKKLFGKKDFMPAYYQQAFYRKTAELLAKHGLKGSILQTTE